MVHGKTVNKAVRGGCRRQAKPLPTGLHPAPEIPSRREQKNWLGGLDSNQDTQIQSLMSYRLDDLPAGGKQKRAEQTTRQINLPVMLEFVNRGWCAE